MAIAGWRNRDGEDEGAGRFAEGGKPFPAPNDVLFRTIDAVQHVQGMSAAVFARLRPLMTLHAGVRESDVAGGAGRRPRPLGSRPPLRMSPLQPVERDFAFVVDAEVPAARIAAATKAADPALIADVQVFDVFAGESLGAGRKSLAIAVTIQPTERTLTEADLEALSTRIARSVEAATGGALRA